jgi:hypothetical protein
VRTTIFSFRRNIQPLRDFGCAEPIGLELLHLGLINRRLPTPVDDCRIGLGDTLKLALAPQVGFELGEDAQHINRSARADRTSVLALPIIPKFGERLATIESRLDLAT